jgi:hypothetical protein
VRIGATNNAAIRDAVTALAIPLASIDPQTFNEKQYSIVNDCSRRSGARPRSE